MTQKSWSRGRERRLQKFGLAAGLVLALVVHLYIFFGPRASYNPALERAKIRRVLVARPYRPPKPVTKVKPPDPVALSQPKKVDNKPPSPAKLSAPKEGKPIRKGIKKSPAPLTTAAQKKTVDTKRSKVQSADLMADQTKKAQGAKEASGIIKKTDEWEDLLAQLEQQHGDIVSEQQRLITQQQHVEVDEQQMGEGMLEDSRIRMKVASYPQTSIDEIHPSISYPDVELRQSQLQKGICRVYLRVWTDKNGNIVREQIKTPQPGPKRELYKIFIDRVVEEVRFWSFPRQKGEIHIDVLFEIE